ncbi:LysR family transcriptional regulator [Amorphus sp. 3PC139-8]|uniref:LysR family transcriptional regulator n=1 Tax=Amorphus sp. 3PC139-8 TaxID=2735676 RepID=UPI00345D05FD
METRFPNIRHLIAFREVAETRRIGLASERVHLSQPAITQAIAKLERDIGAPLFERRPDGMYLSEVGEIFDRRIARVIEHLKLGAQLALRRAPRTSPAVGAREFHKQVTPPQLHALVAIARAGSYSQAAYELGATQPAVHRAARELESLAGTPFFEPSRRGVTLTPSAKAFAHHVRLAAAELRQAHYEISAFQGRDSTRIWIGSLPLSRTSILPTAIDELLVSSGPGLQIRCVDGPYQALLRDLRHGELDFLIGALRDPPPVGDISQEVLFHDQLVIVGNASHPLTRASAPTIADTLAFPWIAPPKDTPSGAYLFQKLKIEDQPQTPVRIVSSSLVLARGLMMRRDYLTIMSENQFEIEREQGLLASMPVPLPDSTRAIGFTYRSDWRPTPTQSRFLDLIRAYCRRAYGEGISSK